MPCAGLSADLPKATHSNADNKPDSIISAQNGLKQDYFAAYCFSILSIFSKP